MTSVSEAIVTFLQVILFANTTAFFCSLPVLVSHSFRKADSGEEISTRTRWPTNAMVYSSVSQSFLATAPFSDKEISIAPLPCLAHTSTHFLCISL